MEFLVYCLILYATIATVMSRSDIDFIRNFASMHDRQAVILYKPKSPCFDLTMAFGRYPALLTQVVQNQDNLTMIGSDIHVFPCPTDTISIENAMKSKHWSHREYWLINVNHIGTDFLQDIASIDIDDNVFVYFSKEDVIEVYEVYRIHPSMPLEIGEYLSWERGFASRSLTLSKYIRRKNMKGARLKVTSTVSQPYTMAIEKAPFLTNHGGYRLEGMFPDIFHFLMKTLNFTYDFVENIDGEYGALKADGSWSGMIRMLQDKKIDIAIADLTVTNARSQVASFATTIKQYYHMIFIKNPKQNYNYFAYLTPLKPALWMAICGFILTVPIVLWRLSCDQVSLQDSVVFTLASFVETSIVPIPTSLHLKIAFGFTMASAVMIFYHWEAMLISHLAIKVTTLPFHNMRELLTGSNYKLGLLPGSFYEDSLKHARDPVWQQIYHERTKPYLSLYKIYSPNVVEIALDNSDTAIYHDYFPVTFHPSFVKCDLIHIPGKYDIKPLSFAFQKDSPYLSLFNFYLNHMVEKGQIDRIGMKYDRESQMCTDYSGKALGMESCFTAFLLLTLAFCLCLLVLLPFENLFVYFKNRSSLSRKQSNNYHKNVISVKRKY